MGNSTGEETEYTKMWIYVRVQNIPGLSSRSLSLEGGEGANR